MGRWPHGHNSRLNVATAVSAAQDRAALADRMQSALEDAGWDVTRLIGHEVTIVLERPSGIPGLVDELRYGGPTVVDALREAVSDLLQRETGT